MSKGQGAVNPCPGRRFAPHQAKVSALGLHHKDSLMNDSKERNERWDRLSGLVAQAHRHGLASLTADELDELAILYRQATTALARARTEDRHPELINYLNQLVGQAHACIYTSYRRSRVRLGYLFAVEVPVTFRRNWRYVAAAFAITLAAATFAYAMITLDYRWTTVFLWEPFAAAVEDFVQSGKPAGEYFAERAEVLGGTNLSAFFMRHNIVVALGAFALGVTLGLGTICMLAANGLMLGTFLAIGAHHGRLIDLVAVVIPHGAIELTALFIAGGAGLMIGHALVAPGDMYRRDALRLAAVQAVKLVLGTIPMFVVAGLIEGLVSPEHRGLLEHNSTRILLGLLTLALPLLYLLFGDRILTWRRHTQTWEP